MGFTKPRILQARLIEFDKINFAQILILRIDDYALSFFQDQIDNTRKIAVLTKEAMDCQAGNESTR
jgi:hypothetical protein